VVEMQRAVGIAAATDGGFRRAELAAEAAFLRTLTRRPIKVAVPAARPSETSDPLARAGVVKKEIEARIAAGVDYIQLDAGYAALFDDPKEKVDELLKLDTSALSGIERPGKVRIGTYLDPGAGGAFGHAINGHEALVEGCSTNCRSTASCCRSMLQARSTSGSCVLCRRGSSSSSAL